jgi:hypothetical protein
MGTSLVQESDLKPRRRRSHKKSSKELYELRRRWKSIIFWLVLSLIGVAVVAAIAVLAGGGVG